MPRSARITVAVTFVLTAVLLAWSGWSQAMTNRRGGLDASLSDAGCFGGVPDSQVGNCDWIRWEYAHWWLPAVLVLVVGLVVAGVIWWVSTPPRTTTAPGTDETESLWS